MDARLRPTTLALAVLVSLTTTHFAAGADHRTTNFIVTAPTQELAVKVAEEAERYRLELAMEWLGRELPRWESPCPVTIQVGPNLGAGGATSFDFSGPRVHIIRMVIQGSRERVLDTVLPHEVNHTIFASHFNRPIPRWADEGASTTVEIASERAKQDRMLRRFLTTDQGIAFDRMFAMTEYPQNVMPLYSQGYSLTRYLLGRGGKARFIEFLGDGMNTNRWPAALNKHYGIRDLSELQSTWVEWVRQGSPDLQNNPNFSPDHPQIAGNQAASQPGASQGTPSGLTGSVASSSTTQPVATTPLTAEGSWYVRQRDGTTRPVQQANAHQVVPPATAMVPVVMEPVEQASATMPPETAPTQTAVEQSPYHQTLAEQMADQATGPAVRSEQPATHPPTAPSATAEGNDERGLVLNLDLPWGAPQTNGAGLAGSPTPGEFDQSTARPQPPQGVQQTILEWVRPAGPPQHLEGSYDGGRILR